MQHSQGRKSSKHVCPQIGDRFEGQFSETTLPLCFGLTSRLVLAASTQEDFFGRPRRVFGFTTSSTARVAFSNRVADR